MPHNFKKFRTEYLTLLKLGFPVMLTQLSVIVIGFADTMMVGAYSVEALASSAFVNNVFLIPLVMLSGFAGGITPLVGALFSQKRHQDSGRVLRAGLQINALLSLVFTLAMGALYFFLYRFGQDEELLPLIRPYYLTMLGTLLPMALFNTFTHASNGMTDTRTPMWCTLAAISLNIFGNWLLIFGHWGFPRLGLVGAGISTVFARFSGFLLILLIYIYRKRYAACRDSLLRASKLGRERSRVWDTSYPIMFQAGIECSLWAFGGVVCGWFGKIQLAAFQIVNTIGQLGFMTFMSFGVAVSVRVANFTGLQDERGAGRAARAGLHLNLVLATLASALIALFARPMLGIFTENADVIAAGMLFILPLVLYQYLDATQITFINAIRGTSKVKPLLWIALTSYVFTGIPLMLLFAKPLGWEGVGVYYSFDVALLVAAIYATIVFRRTTLTPLKTKNQKPKNKN